MSQEEVNQSDSPMGDLILNIVIFLLFCTLAGHGMLTLLRWINS